ncbi:D-inositol-3-phosphate glycosyltransferase [subsurface metagenome]
MFNSSRQSKVKVLHIIPDERLGGPQQRVLQVAKRLKEEGFISIVAMPEGDKTFANLLDESDIPYYQVKNFKRLQPTLNPLVHIKWLLFFIPGMLSLTGLMKGNKVNIVHVNGHMYLQGPLAAKLSGAKLVWHLNDVATPKVIRIFLLPFLYFMPDRIAVSSKAVARYDFGENSAYANNAALLYPPVDTSRFHPNYDVKEYQREFGLKGSDKVVGIVGNINPTKGYEHFFLAAKMIKEELSSVKFLVVGKRLETAERYWQRLQLLIDDLGIRDQVILTGGRTDIPQVMNVIDIFVLASLSEAAPIVVLEAMSCAKPVVATSVGGVPEVVINGENGILVSPKDPKAIAEAVLYLLNHQREAKQIGLNGRRRAMEYFDIKKCAQKYRDLYESLVT